jgi:putative peptidoglycan lipid II flippase
MQKANKSVTQQPRSIASTSSSSHPAFLVASGIFLSRVAGLVRDRVLAHFLGSTDAADAFRAALRIPNFLQNLFGEGVLSASFIPVYARLLGSGKEREADGVAGAIGAILAVLVSILVALGMLAAPWLIGAIAPGFTGAKRELTVTLVQILFPGVGALVLSAWCLGILNSHGRFFLSYSAPVIWNLCIIAGVVIFRATPSLSGLAIYAAIGAVVGSTAQLLVQLPTVAAVTKGMSFGFQLRSAEVQTVIRNFGPVFISRGVVQLSAYIDSLLASLLPSGSVALLFYGQTIALLPVSLFGMSISAAELPAMSRSLAGETSAAFEMLRKRLSTAIRRLAFFVVPSAVGFFAFGDTIAGAIYQTGRFTRADTLFVWALLAGSGIGLVASTSGRLCSSAFYALRDTRTPLRYAIVRVFLTTLLGYLCAFPLPRLLQLDPRWGIAGLTASAGVAGWIEFLLLRQGLRKRIGSFSADPQYYFLLWGAAIAAALIAFPMKSLAGADHPVLSGVVVLPLYVICYCAITLILRVPEARGPWRRKAY